MGYRTLEINLISARGLKQVNLITKMDVYAVVSIIGDDTKDKQKSPVDREGNTNPTWNIPMKFSVDESAVERNCLTLEFMLRCQRNLGDKDVGEVNVPIKELLYSAGESKVMQFVQYQVKKPSGKPKGELSFSYKFDQKNAATRKTSEKVEEKVNVNTDHVTAYPTLTPAARTSNMYPPPYEMTGTGTGVGGYPPPVPVVSYNYPPPQYGGYPQQGSALQYGGYPPPYYQNQPQPSYGYPQVQQ